MAHADYRHTHDPEGRDRFHIYNFLDNRRTCIKMQVKDDLVVSLAISPDGTASILVHPESDPHQFYPISSVVSDSDSKCVERADVFDLLNVLAEFTDHELRYVGKL